MTFWETVLALVVGFAIRDGVLLVFTAAIKATTAVIAVRAWTPKKVKGAREI